MTDDDKIDTLEDINVAAFDPMPSPAELHARLPMSKAAARTVSNGRKALNAILDRQDPRLFVVVGPVPSTTRSPAWIMPAA